MVSRKSSVNRIAKIFTEIMYYPWKLKIARVEIDRGNVPKSPSPVITTLFVSNHVLRYRQSPTLRKDEIDGWNDSNRLSHG
ncbi:MAG: hypothetical protein CMN58_04740 [Solibacterales bacterium]|nr:hypothetical protein [Bryobacterales bacterium]